MLMTLLAGQSNIYGGGYERRCEEKSKQNVL